jgi:hypothetical protein
MVAVALWAAVFAFVFPTVFRAVFHAELLAACWVLADQRLVVRALAAAKTMALSQTARLSFKLPAALLVGACGLQPFSACQP